ncbi:MAG: carboxypeptidase-like regulatory domain-containing protein [Elusimicrobia bacterium]|nr:carboxypeptidase-like regulatory domain-containing protein [Elusimicrobiota bacterium]
MSAPAKCPLCGTKLQPDMEGCPNCPMSFLDAPPEKSAFQNDNFRNFGLPILFFGGFAYAIWAFSQYMWRTAEKGTETVSTLAKTVAGAPAPKGGGVVPVDSKAIQGLVLEQTTGVYDPTGGEGAGRPAAKRAEEDEGPGTISIMPEKGARPKVVSEWKMRGVIYDLITLKPVPGVHMIFTDNVTNSRAQIKTDAEGRYRVLLPTLPGRGYLVTLSKTGYEKSYLDPGTEGVAEMPLERRQEIAKELSSLIAEPASLQPNSDTPLVTDFHMAPK